MFWVGLGWVRFVCVVFSEVSIGWVDFSSFGLVCVRICKFGLDFKVPLSRGSNSKMWCIF